MATRSIIASVDQNNEVRSVYCHWDGYPLHNGRILRMAYSDQSKVDSLLDMGNISTLANTLEECKFYARDRNEEGQDAIVDNYDEFVEDIQNGNCEEYTYLFKDGEWLCYVGTGPEPMKIDDAIYADARQQNEMYA